MKEETKKQKDFNLEVFFAALADRTRLRLLNLMRSGEVCVCFFAETLGTNNPKISRHLSYLKRAELVAGRRDGKWMHYRMTEPKDEQASEIFRRIMEMLNEDKEMQIDRKNLANVCCAPQLVGISSARKPNITRAVTSKKVDRN